MRFAARYLSYAEQLLKDYDPSQPFSAYLKQYFANNKKFGSRDRKSISHACYCYWRLGKALLHLDTNERIATGIYLCTDHLSPWEEIIPSNLPLTASSLQEKLAHVQGFDEANVFPLFHHCDAVDASFILSHLTQPDLFMRLRPGKEKEATRLLDAEGISYTRDEYPNCVRLPNATSLPPTLQLNKTAVVQDLSSQRVGELLQPLKRKVKTTWDCCAASGGKTILAKDILGEDVSVFATDIRPSIISNLHKRMKQAGISNYNATVADLSSNNPLSFGKRRFDLIICDVPCSGSGTWGRTPEQLSHFEEEKIEHYASLQKNIVQNAAPYLKPGGHLLYVTCSVFKEENQENIAFISRQLNLKLTTMQYMEGHAQKADTLFAALFIA